MRHYLLLILLLGSYQLPAQTSHSDSVFTAHFRRTSGWTAGELTQSIHLPDGKILWVFKGSNIDNFNAVDTSVTCTTQVPNSMLLHDPVSGSFTTIIDNTSTGTARAPFKIPGNTLTTFQPGGAGYAIGDTAFVFLTRFNSLNKAGTYVAKIYLPDLTPINPTAAISLHLLPSMNGIDFVSAVFVDPDSDYVYIYGVKPEPAPFNFAASPYVARCSKSNILGTWQFYTGLGWSTNAASAQKAVSEATSPHFSVLKMQGKIYMISQEPNFFSRCTDAKNVYVYTSNLPYGFTNRKVVYTIDTLDPGNRYKGNNIRTYNGTAHIQFTAGNELLFSYNVNNTCPTSCTAGRLNADLFRPKFVRIPFATIDETLGTPVVAGFKAKPNWNYAPLRVSFNAAGSKDSAGNALTYSWDLGDGNVGSGVNPTHTYVNPGEYTARLIVTDANGNSDTSFTTINALTPTTASYKDYTFTDFFRRTKGWTASDATISVPLPNGKSLWYFGDSNIDDFRDSDSSISCAFVVNNSVLLQDAVNRDSMITILDNSQTGFSRSPFKIAGDNLNLFWPAHGYVRGDTLYAFLKRFVKSGLAYLGTYVSKTHWPTFDTVSAIASLTPLPAMNDIIFGMGTIVDSASNLVYVYGTKKHSDLRLYPYAARFPYDNVLGTWEFYNGSGWTTDADSATAVSAFDVSPSFSVFPYNGKYYIVTQENGYLTCGLGRNIYGLESATPFGPFINRKTLFTIEDKYEGSYMKTYNAHAHPQFTENNELLISYNVNDVCPSGCNMNRKDPDLYRPKFIRTPLWLLDSTVEDPSALFTTTQTSSYAPSAIIFDASASKDPLGYPLTYTWDFGDGTTATGKMVSHTYKGPGIFTAVLTVTNPHGGTGSSSTLITTAGGLKVQYQVKKNNKPTDGHIRPDFKIVNTSNRPVPYSELTLRYWYTREGSSGQAFWCDYAALGTNKVQGTFVPLANPVANANFYLELSFSAAGSIAAGGSSGDIKTRFNKTDWSNYAESDDYAYDPSKTSYADWNRITLYRNGVLFWGTEPTGNEVAGSQGYKDNNISLHSRLIIYPNPADADEVKMFSTIEPGSEVQVSVHNVLGVKVLKENCGVKSRGLFIHTLNISSLPPGLYIVTLTTGTTSQSAKLIRRRL